jgi:predicted dinucleotide-utilizing enzyme
MQNGRKTRIGIAGFGFIGRHLFQSIQDHPEWGLEPAFVWNRSRNKLADVPPELVLNDLTDAVSFKPDLIVECAHPKVTYEHGAGFLQIADYLPLSVNALADEETEAMLVAVAKKHGRRILVPHGALIGLDNLIEVRDTWKDVTITFRKHPSNIDFSESGMDPAQIKKETVLYDGPVRGISKLFPRNVNTMTTCGLATVGLDRCRAVLIANPSLNVAIAEVEALGKDGSVHQSRKIQPVVGVSGTEMLAAQVGSVLRAANVFSPGMNFV